MTTKRKTTQQITDVTPAVSEAVTNAAGTPQANTAPDIAPQGTATSNLPRPRPHGTKPIVVTCPMSQEQAALQQALIARSERLRSQKIDPRVDNNLAITADGRTLALDARMLSPNAPDHSGSKINTLVDNVYAIWQRTETIGGTQLIFADIGSKPTPWGFSASDEIINKLVARGIPRQQIAASGDADNQPKKRSLFDRVRAGRVRVLLGSTQKMGAGTNVPKHLVALHHLDCPLTPTEFTQRESRSLDQGNDNEKVASYRYVTEKSLDTLMWQALLTRAEFISQVMARLDDAGANHVIIGHQEISGAEGQNRQAEEGAATDSKGETDTSHADKWQRKLTEQARTNTKQMRGPE